MNLRFKLGVGFGVQLCLLLGLGGVSYYGTRRLSQAAQSAKQAFEMKELATAIELAARKQMQAANDYTFTGSEPAEKRYQESKNDLQQKIGTLERAGGSAGGNASTDRIRESTTKMTSLTEQQINLRHQSRTYEATDLAFSPTMEKAENELAEASAELEAGQDTLVQRGLNEQHSTELRAKLISLCLMIGGLIVGAGTATLIARSVTTNLGQMLGVIQEIAGRNLAVNDLSIDSKDEIGQAGTALNVMKNNLGGLVRKISDTAGKLARASEAISGAATRQAQAAESQRDQAMRVATAMQEVSSSVVQVCNHSNRAADASSQAAETARSGGNIVEETLAKMRVIASSVGAVGEKMENLGKSSDQIGHIAGVIDDIADQTNLLALNAAIEAARAGKQGRGFAVVADEVRKLAERTTTATEEIAQMIKNIQDETKSAVSAMEQGMREVEDGVASTTRAGESLKQIIHKSDQVGEDIRQIAAMASSQSQFSEEVNRNMEEIANLVKEAAEDARRSEHACQELSGLAIDLKNTVANFKIRNSEHVRLVETPGPLQSSLAPIAPGRQRAASTGA